MSQNWQLVQQRKKPRDSSQENSGLKAEPLTEKEVQTFLSSFKVESCQSKEYHDHRLCRFYHDERDRRRNPYRLCYNVEESKNNLEKMYHPLVFRTALCRRTDGCLFGNKLCAHAHSSRDLRERVLVLNTYEEALASLIVGRKQPTISSFLPEKHAKPKRDFQAECLVRWKETRMTPTSRFIELNSMQWFLLQRSTELQYDIEEVAFENGCGSAVMSTRSINKGRCGLTLNGIDIDTIEGCIISLFDLKKYRALEEREYGTRVINSVKHILQNHEDAHKLAGSDNVLIEVRGTSLIRIVAVENPTGVSGESRISQVFQKLDFWVNQEGYGDFTQCSCCFEECNADQGVTCDNGHFYCSIEGCFALAVGAQINNLGCREDGILCPECNAPYNTQLIAPHLPPGVWKDVQKALIDKQVKQQHEKMAREFDQRLEARVQELLDSYGEADKVLKQAAQKEALTIRNTILNLSCPHCKTAYFEFSGCMALACETCKKHFCGYCHQACSTSRGTHEHVRTCILNETTNGSYYATEAEIEAAQRRYRTRALRKYLGNFKKERQNAIVIELERELKDLDIQPAALFEFGNLQEDAVPQP